jgi:hypothetical protein
MVSRSPTTTFSALGSACLLGPVSIAGVQNDRVTLAREQLSGHEAKTRRRAGNENARHAGYPSRLSTQLPFLRTTCVAFAVVTCSMHR